MLSSPTPRLSAISRSGGRPSPLSRICSTRSLSSRDASTAIHPGEHLAEELRELGVSPTELAARIEVPEDRIAAIIDGRRRITADTALRLARYFGTSERFWLNLQARYDLEIEKDRLGKRLQREVKTSFGTRRTGIAGQL